MIHKGKNVPCEGCRERKKKCSSGQPCERCKRLGIECQYLKPATPPDLNYVDMVNNHELKANVDKLEHLIKYMEEEMRQLQQSSHCNRASPTYSSLHPLIAKRELSSGSIPIESSDCSIWSVSTIDSPSTITTTTPPLHPTELTAVKKRKPQNQYYPQSTITTNWKLKLGPHGLCIETNILSYDDLMHQIQAFAFAKTLNEEPITPLFKQPSNSTHPTIPRYALNSPMRRAHFRAIKQCITLNEQHSVQEASSSSPSLSLTLSLKNEKNDVNASWNSDHDRGVPSSILHFKQQNSQHITLKLIDIFFSCQFYQNMCLHRNTFYSLFVDQDDPEASPVVCALTAAILTMHCHHILEIIPYSQQINAHSYFISRAKYLLSNVFDELTLEPYLTYLFMALYYIKLQRPRDAIRYFEQCIRIRHLLVDEYMPKKGYSDHTGEQELFKRSHKVLFMIARQVEFLHNRRGIIVRSMEHKRQTIPPLVNELKQYVKPEDCLPTSFPDEDARVSRVIKQDGCSDRIYHVLTKFLAFTRYSQDPVPLPMLVKTEAALNEYYFKDLPPEFRLALNIFEDNLSDEEFRRRLADDDNSDAASITLAIRYYQAVISIHEPFVPTLPPEYNLNSTAKDTPGTLPILSMDEDHSASEKHEEHERAMHTLRAFEICYRSSIILVRLLEYMIVTLDICTDSLMPCLLTAWDTHVRNACLGLTDPEKAQKHVPTQVVKVSREYVLRCVAIVRKGYHYNAADKGLWEHYQSVESELLNAMFVTRPYSAQYWDSLGPTNTR
ncbi:hypothetical protein INT45_001004 [Circinella minor]|uniref:Zn(2)-C6 fungal-type domain-containing protein n=1 Tax=Circinella minor TaxID=1195481 RepID=A0A8H7VPL4_9FUNG|nr:hypothetical protein INT45_001004 [Circinella minor]